MESRAVLRCSVFLFVFVFSLLVLIPLCDSTAAEEADSKEFAVTLDATNFTDFVAKHRFIVIEFYAPWCGHCKKLAPEYEKAASILSLLESPVVLAKVDASNQKNKALAAEFEVSGYPTLKILRYGGSYVQEYNGPRDADGIVNYLNKQSGPASLEFQAPGDVQSVMEDSQMLIVGVFPKLSGEEFENFTMVAERLRADYEFRHTMDPSLLPRGDLSIAGPLVRLFKPFDELFVDFQDFEVDALVGFVEEKSTPLVTLFNKDPRHHPFVNKFFNNQNAKAMLFLNFGADKFEAFREKYQEVAQLNKGNNLSFLMGDAEASHGAFQYFGLKDHQVPLIIIQAVDEQKYLKANIEPDQIAAWINDFKDGIMQAYQKSEPIPEVNDKPVKIVVADSLHDMVLKSSTNVLLEFYAPSCTHCKRLAPILDEVAVELEKETDIMVAKIDATANYIPRGIFEVKGYPTLYFRSSTGNILKYEGDRTKEAIIGFIQKNKEVRPASHHLPKDEL